MTEDPFITMTLKVAGKVKMTRDYEFKTPDPDSFFVRKHANPFWVPLAMEGVAHKGFPPQLVKQPVEDALAPFQERGWTRSPFRRLLNFNIEFGRGLWEEINA